MASSLRTVTFKVADVVICSAVYVVPTHPSKSRFPYDVPQSAKFILERLEGFLVDEVALGLVFLQVLALCPLVILPALRTRIHLPYMLY